MIIKVIQVRNSALTDLYYFLWHETPTLMTNWSDTQHPFESVSPLQAILIIDMVVAPIGQVGLDEPVAAGEFK